MTNKDRIIRKTWLLSYIIITAAEFIYAYSTQMKPAFTAQDITTISIAAFLTILVVYIYYHCAYKKPGTKLLTFSLIIAAFSFIVQIVLLSTGNIIFSESGLHPIHLIPALWMFILTWKLRKINKKLQKA